MARRLLRAQPEELRVGSAAEMPHLRFVDCARLGWALSQDLCAVAAELHVARGDTRVGRRAVRPAAVWRPPAGGERATPVSE